LVAAVALPTLTAWVFTFQLGQGTWNDPLLVPTLLASSAAAGVALAVLAALALAARTRENLTRAVRDRVAVVVLSALAAMSALTALGYVTALTSGPRERAAVQVVLPGGSWAWVFWTQWLAVVVAVVLLVVPRLRRATAWAGAAMAATTAAVLSLYVALIPAGQVRPPVSLPPGTGTGRWAADVPSFVQTGSYHPSWTEYGVAVGLVALFVTVLLLASGPRPSQRHRH
jgi:Ni/Fe-hydrogenase subunit HybB-like protein